MLILVIEAKCYSLRGVSSEPTTTGRSLLPRKWRCRTMADQTGPRHSTLWSRGWARALTPKRRPVSHPRSSNRTCGFPASGFPTGFTARLTNEGSIGQLEAAGLRVPQTPLHRRRAGATRLHRKLVLRLAIQLHLKFPDLTRCCQTHRQSPFLPSFTSTPSLPSWSVKKNSQKFCAARPRGSTSCQWQRRYRLVRESFAFADSPSASARHKVCRPSSTGR